MINIICGNMPKYTNSPIRKFEYMYPEIEKGVPLFEDYVSDKINDIFSNTDDILIVTQSVIVLNQIAINCKNKIIDFNKVCITYYLPSAVNDEIESIEIGINEHSRFYSKNKNEQSLMSYFFSKFKNQIRFLTS